MGAVVPKKHIYIHTHLNFMSEIMDSFINIRAEQKYGFVFLSETQRLSKAHNVKKRRVIKRF